VLCNLREHSISGKKNRVALERTLRNVSIRRGNSETAASELPSQVAHSDPVFEGRVMNREVLE
jgi:hypothetical protein